MGVVNETGGVFWKDVGRVPAAPHANAYCTEAVTVIAAARTRIAARKQMATGSKGQRRQTWNELDPPSPVATMSDATTPTSSRPTNARLPSLAQIAARQVHNLAAPIAEDDNDH